MKKTKKHKKSMAKAEDRTENRSDYIEADGITVATKESQSPSIQTVPGDEKCPVSLLITLAVMS